MRVLGAGSDAKEVPREGQSEPIDFLFEAKGKAYGEKGPFSKSRPIRAVMVQGVLGPRGDKAGATNKQQT